MADVYIIKPKKKIGLDDLKEVWLYRTVLYFLSWKDFRVRYKQTIIGIAWALIQPFMVMVVFSIFFGKLAKMPSDGIPYPVFVYAGLLFWQLFSNSLTDMSRSLVSNANMLTKVYFPRLILPLSAIATKLIDFLIASLILAGLMIYYHFIPTFLGFLLLPLLILITVMAAVGAGLFLSFINVKYRDVYHILPYFIQTMLFVTPVIYPSSIVGRFAWLLDINPMAGVIKTARDSLFGNAINWQLLLTSFIIALALLLIGLFSFKRAEPYFADIV